MINSFEKKIDDLKFQLESGVSENIDLSVNDFKKTRKPISIDEQENSSLSEINNLSELKKYIEEYSGCSLKDTAKNTVFCDGNENSNIMIIGEAPGNQEDIEGKPFVGKSGKLLDKILNFINIDRNSCYIANIIPWRPPGNRNPSSEELKTCLPFIKKHINLTKPKILLLVGSVSAKALLETDLGITKLRGEWKIYKDGELEIPTLPIFHPAYLLRRPTMKSLVMKDILLLNKRINEVNKEIIND